MAAFNDHLAEGRLVAARKELGAANLVAADVDRARVFREGRSRLHQAEAHTPGQEHHVAIRQEPHHALQQGKKGGSFYLSPTGQKVYVGKGPHGHK
jgi:hypothetical protein